MTGSSLVRTAALVVSLSGALLCAERASAQQAQNPSRAYTGIAGCWAIESATWPEGISRRVRLTLDPVENGDPSVVQYRMIAAEDERDGPARYPYRSWSLYADGHVVSIVWSSDRDQMGVTFEPDLGHKTTPAAGSVTFFRHDRMETSDPVEVTVRSVSC